MGNKLIPCPDFVSFGSYIYIGLSVSKCNFEKRRERGAGNKGISEMVIF